jgi:plasmid replication initiation protein
MSTTVVVAKIDQGKLIVTQANKLAEASYSMTLEEKRVVLLIVSLVRKEDGDFKTYRIPITDIRDYLNLRSNKLYADIKRVADALMSRVLHIPEEGGGWLKVGWLSSARYVPKGYRGAETASLEVCFSPEMKPYLLELKAHFSSYMLQNVAGLRSFYSIRLYELLQSRRRLKAAMFEVATLRKILKAENKYANYKDFRARVILTAQAELEAKTDLAFEFLETRRGRKVMSINFVIRDNHPVKSPRSLIGPAKLDQPAAVNDNQPPLYAEAMAEGKQNGLREGVMRELLAKRDSRHVLENIELARARHLRSKSPESNLAGLTVAAITHDYAAEERAKRQAAAERQAGREQAKAEEAALTAQGERQKRDMAARLAALPKHKLKALRTAFAKEISGGRYGRTFAANFQAKGWQAPGVEVLLRGWVGKRVEWEGRA